MLIGDPSEFAVESGITKAYERLSFRALGYFVFAWLVSNAWMTVMATIRTRLWTYGSTLTNSTRFSKDGATPSLMSGAATIHCQSVDGTSEQNQPEVILESQRDSITEPRVARNELPWETVPNSSSTLKELSQIFPNDATPSELCF